MFVTDKPPETRAALLPCTGCGEATPHVYLRKVEAKTFDSVVGPEDFVALVFECSHCRLDRVWGIEDSSPATLQ